VKRPPGATGFVVIPRRWVVDRTFAWITKCRRLGPDLEQMNAVAETLITIAARRRWVATSIAPGGTAAAADSLLRLLKSGLSAMRSPRSAGMRRPQRR
jgi:hypothetical protein